MTRICAIDTETTSLRYDRRAWEVGIITRDPSGTEYEYHAFVDARDLELGNADLQSLNIGRYYQRHPDALLAANPDNCIPDVARCKPESQVMREVEAITRGAHLVGAVISFDAEVLGNRMRANGICPSWHYHLIDCEALAVGYLTYREMRSVASTPRNFAPPWKSDDLSSALGVTVSDEDRHTALGDAKWAMRVYDAVMGNTP
jgi:DNA polymerase III epsilon subunit-like protein